MNYQHIDDDFEFEYFDEIDHEEERLKETTRLNQISIITFEKRYGCTFPEFILKATTSNEKIDLILWSTALRYLAVNNEKVYKDQEKLLYPLS
ncbi:MAG TPA: hypothetical protein VJ824_16100 [Bacillota bacterium]|nr:hypothetical protein [Bacillota bacterium]